VAVFLFFIFIYFRKEGFPDLFSIIIISRILEFCKFSGPIFYEIEIFTTLSSGPNLIDLLPSAPREKTGTSLVVSLIHALVDATRTSPSFVMG
jgi:hypothetical protein